MKNLIPTIIHRPERTDRQKFIDDIKDYFIRIKILDAITAKNANMPNENCDFGAGCGASHLTAIEESNKNKLLLVLEDDAVIDVEKYKQFLSLSNPPKDCGIILLGADELPKSTGSWTHVNNSFFGSHALIYMPIIHKTKFLQNAWKYLFFFPKEGPLSWMTENILKLAIESVNLKIYRPIVLPFTAGESISDRTKQSFSRNNKEI
jgi:GR25 family glycosyltransferase involved in LPS biosynthesis